jgi:hypothetical protein
MSAFGDKADVRSANENVGFGLAIHTAVQLEAHFRHVHTSCKDQVICFGH